MDQHTEEFVQLVKAVAEHAEIAAEQSTAAVKEVGVLTGEVKVLGNKFDNLNEEVHILSKVVRGNGDISGSLVARVQALEATASGIAKNCAERSKKIDGCQLEDRKGKWMLIIASVGGFCGIVSSVIAAFGK